MVAVHGVSIHHQLAITKTQGTHLQRCRAAIELEAREHTAGFGPATLGTDSAVGSRELGQPVKLQLGSFSA